MIRRIALYTEAAIIGVTIIWGYAQSIWSLIA